MRWHLDDVEWHEKWEIGRTGAACLGFYTNDAHVERITKNVLERPPKQRLPKG